MKVVCLQEKAEVVGKNKKFHEIQKNTCKIQNLWYNIRVYYDFRAMLAYKGGKIMQTLFIVLHIIVSVLLIAVVLLQEGKDPGMRGIQGASSDMGDSFFKRAGGTTKEKMQMRLTTTVSVLFLITTFVLVVLVA